LSRSHFETKQEIESLKTKVIYIDDWPMFPLIWRSPPPPSTAHLPHLRLSMCRCGAPCKRTGKVAKSLITQTHIARLCWRFATLMHYESSAVASCENPLPVKSKMATAH